MNPRLAADAASMASGRWLSFTAATFFFDDAGTFPGVAGRPIEDPGFEDFVQDVFEPSFEVFPSRLTVEATDAIENFPHGDRTDMESLTGDAVKELPDPVIGVGSHHFRDDVRVKQP